MAAAYLVSAIALMPRPPGPARLVLRLLEEAQAPIFALDSSRQIIFANRALSEWVGLSADQLVSQRCDYHAGGCDAPVAAACAALCPPPEAFSGQVADGFISRLAAGPLAFERRPARFVHIAGGGPGEALLLVVVQPALPPGEEPAAGPSASEKLHSRLLELRSQLGKRFHISQLIGASDAISRVREQIRIAAEARARVLVVGPPGSGREHVARTIHYAQNSLSIGPLVPIACPLVDVEQMQASLTSLLRRQHDEPTERPPAALLLDVDRLRPDAQQELAGFLHLPKIELHTLATSRVSLQRLAARGKFRRDLAYELATLTIALPPLASRREDIPLLAQHFLEEANTAGARQLAGFQPAALELLPSLPWVGNLDELAEAVREACRRASGSRVCVADLPDWVHLAQDATARPPRDEEPIELDTFLSQIERELLSRALRKTRGNKSKAAELLGLTRQRLLRRLAQLGLAVPAEVEEPIIFEPLPEEP
jgi:transcriptional regulator of aromatic amino acid metabolism